MEENINLSEMKQKFELKLSQIIKSALNDLITYDRYLELIEEVKEAKTKKYKSIQDYNLIEKYDVLEYGGTKKLITPVSVTSGKILYYIHDKNIFDVLHACHIGSGHGDVKRMINHLKTKYINVTSDIVTLYISLCNVCQKRPTHSTKKTDNNESLILNNMTRGLIDIFDMQNCKDGEYNFILVYQDYFSKFICLKALKTLAPLEVAPHLMDVFCLFGVPSILQSYSNEFTKSVIDLLQEMWNGLKIIAGSSHLHLDDSLERTYQDIKRVLHTWMMENNSTKWSEGLKYCQFRKNNAFSRELKQTPFKAMFGREASVGFLEKRRVGFASTTIPCNVIASIESEDDLKKVFCDIEKTKELGKKFTKGSGQISITPFKRPNLQEVNCGPPKKCRIKINLSKNKTLSKSQIISNIKTELNGISETNKNVVLKTEEVNIKPDILDIKHEIIDIKHEIIDLKHEILDIKPEVIDIIEEDPLSDTVKVEPCDDNSYQLEDIVDESL